jgi:hypothetical protein
MLRTIEGIYDNGVVKFDEAPPTLKRAKVLITFLEESESIKLPKRRAGGLAGQIWMAEDFNEPLEDLNDYI